MGGMRFPRRGPVGRGPRQTRILRKGTGRPPTFFSRGPARRGKGGNPWISRRGGAIRAQASTPGRSFAIWRWEKGPVFSPRIHGIILAGGTKKMPKADHPSHRHSPPFFANEYESCAARSRGGFRLARAFMGGGKRGTESGLLVRDSHWGGGRRRPGSGGGGVGCWRGRARGVPLPHPDRSLWLVSFPFIFGWGPGIKSPDPRLKGKELLSRPPGGQRARGRGGKKTPTIGGVIGRPHVFATQTKHNHPPVVFGTDGTHSHRTNPIHEGTYGPRF